MDNLSGSAVTFFLKPLQGVKQQEGSQRSSKGSEICVPPIRYSQNGDDNPLLEKWRLKENSRKEQSAFFTKNMLLWIAMVTCMQDITGQQVRRDSFLKFPFLLHTLNVCFGVTSCPGLQGGFCHRWEKGPLRIQACNHQLKFSLSNKQVGFKLE